MGNGLSSPTIKLDYEASDQDNNGATTKKYMNIGNDSKPLTGSVTFHVTKKIKSGRAIFVDVCCSEHVMKKIKGFKDSRGRPEPDR